MGVSFDATAALSPYVFLGSNKLSLGPRSAVNVGTFLDGCAKIDIREGVRIGPYVKILTGTHIAAASVMRRNLSEETVCLPVTIERGCWIGMGAMIMPGVIIGEGCVIAAGAVVTKSTQPNGLYAGVPAIRKRTLSTRDDPVDQPAHPAAKSAFNPFSRYR